MSLDNDGIPQPFIDATNDVLAKLEFRIEQYFSSFKHREYADIYDYIVEVEEPLVTILNGVARVSDKGGGYYDIKYKRKAKPETNIIVQGLPFDEINVKFDYPNVLFGEASLVPKIIYTVKAPVAYPGNFGLVWEPLVHARIDPKFHPFTELPNRNQELLQYYNEGVVDLFCDILNRGAYNQVERLQHAIDELANGVLYKHFNFQKNFNIPPNVIAVPIYGMYKPEEDAHYISVESWAFGQPTSWISPVPVILGMLYPLTALMGMFDQEGEFIDGAEPIEIRDVKRDMRILSKSAKEIDRDWDPFNVKQTVKRDEFGFIISEDDETGGLGTRDLTSARKSLWDLEREREQKLKEEAMLAEPANLDIKNYANAQEFFDVNQMKRFTVKGTYSHLPFQDKSKIEIVKACKPPFVLRFARDKIRMRMQVTSRKAIDVLFQVYNMGYLVEM